MPTGSFDINELKRRMQGATQSLKHELGGLRTGRAAASMLEPVQVDAYGTHMPLNQLVKVAHKYAEAARVAVRHVRRDGLDMVKKLEKNHEISEDDQERLANDVQKATDGTISEIDQLLAAKEKEILTV